MMLNRENTDSCKVRVTVLYSNAKRAMPLLWGVRYGRQRTSQTCA
jgi:hypothetical protein